MLERRFSYRLKELAGATACAKASGWPVPSRAWQPSTFISSLQKDFIQCFQFIYNLLKLKITREGF